LLREYSQVFKDILGQTFDKQLCDGEVRMP